MSQSFASESAFKKPFIRLGEEVMFYMNYVGGCFFLGLQAFKLLVTGRFQWKTVFEQAYHLGVKSISLTSIVAIFTGMVLALQFIVGLRRFGLELYSGQIVGIAIVRELGPVLTAIMVAARVGSGITAEIASMAVSEQVMAIRAMGANPVLKLVVPRLIVVTLITPLLTVFADIVGIFGGMVVTVFEAGISYQFFIDQVLKTVEMRDFFSGLAKTFVFGYIIALIACYQGLITHRGTQEVGVSTTRSVVIASLAVFISDYFLTKLIILLW